MTSLIGRRWRLIRRRVGFISTARAWPATQGAPLNYTNLCDEPADHALGRSRGGLTTKIHHLCDGRGLPLVVLIGPGHAHDSPMFDPLMGQLRVPRVGPGRPRTRPAAVLGDKAYSSRAHRARLRARGICAVIPEQSTQIDHRRRRGSRGGRPVGLDAQNPSAATPSNDPSTSSRTGAAWPPATTSSPSPTVPPQSSPPSAHGYDI